MLCLSEMYFFQSKLTNQGAPESVEQIAKKFNDFMIAEKVNVALGRLSETESLGILQTNNETIDLLKEKHPNGAIKFVDLLLHGPEESFEECACEAIVGRTLIQK